MNNTSAALKWFWHHVRVGGSRQDSGHPGTVQLSLSPRWLWLLFADDRLWWRIMFLAAVVKGGFNCMGENPRVAKEILLDNCFTVKWSVRICSETTTIVPEVKIQHHIVHYYADRERERVTERTLKVGTFLISRLVFLERELLYSLFISIFILVDY